MSNKEIATIYILLVLPLALMNRRVMTICVDSTLHQKTTWMIMA